MRSQRSDWLSAVDRYCLWNQSWYRFCCPKRTWGRGVRTFFVSQGHQSEVWGQRSTEALCLVTLEVMNSSLVSMSGVRRQARNFLEVRAVSSWRTPETHDTMGLSCCPPDPAHAHTQQDPEGFTRAHSDSGVKNVGQCWEGSTAGSDACRLRSGSVNQWPSALPGWCRGMERTFLGGSRSLAASCPSGRLGWS